jgi:hypothetical protein
MTAPFSIGSEDNIIDSLRKSSARIASMQDKFDKLEQETNELIIEYNKLVSLMIEIKPMLSILLALNTSTKLNPQDTDIKNNIENDILDLLFSKILNKN